ncbi:MAG: hypothetical protein IT581_02135 [Verrucomicrobiales bacterium]|nr:hypothetical protein [Verrucomicrobiales bacterium]
MKTTVEIPDRLFRDAKAAAAKRGISLKTLLTEALAEKLSRRRAKDPGWPVHPPTVDALEIGRIRSVIHEEFSKVDPEDWR